MTTGLAFLVTVSTGDTTDIIIMFIFTIVFNIVQGNVVAPIVYGRAVSLHPAIILIAIPAGAALAGIAGMFLIVPVIGVIAATWSSLLLSLDDSAEAAPAGGPDPATVGPSSTADEAAAPLGMTGEAQP